MIRKLQIRAIYDDFLANINLTEEQQFETFYNRLKNCPVNAVAVYGNQPVFTCPNNNSCGCSGNFTNFI